MCHGFGRIRPCVLEDNYQGWRIGPLLADTPPLAELLIRELVGDLDYHRFFDCSTLNLYANLHLLSLGFEEISKNIKSLYAKGDDIENESSKEVKRE